MTFPAFPPRIALILFMLLLGAAPAARAQKYRTAAGVRLGAGNYGLTLQQKIFEKTTLEGLGLVGNREVSAALLAERHFGILGPSLNYYLGAGGHVGNHKDDGAFGGVDVIVGLEYKLPITRLVLSADFKPSVEFGSSDWARFPTAISVRYILVKERKTGFLNNVFGGDKDKKKSRSREKSGTRRGLFDF
ncbi:hypothetical protein F1C16_19000 [Hymenobacter sp. NBH84]|uniref:hypothetical protein n=1 Tax=Hymenobacter sp. NBH84 TaxID=2596915 RepID=UPI00162A3D70|nr:hypothetical protein [Hymenobacter sp. NBH84]QNE41501.1 hypothetical protein F1C16_19000 [Hymenobacter sp. NBH84]